MSYCVGKVIQDLHEIVNCSDSGSVADEKACSEGFSQKANQQPVIMDFVD